MNGSFVTIWWYSGFCPMMYAGEGSDHTGDYVVFFSEIRDHRRTSSLSQRNSRHNSAVVVTEASLDFTGVALPCLLPAVLPLVLPQRLPFSVSRGSFCFFVCHLRSVCRILVP